MASVTELYDLYTESLVREIIEKTKTCALTWVSLGGSQFKATQIDTSNNPSITWDFYVTKTAIGNASAKYTLDVKQDSVAITSIVEGPLPHTARDSVVQELYETVEIIVMKLDKKLVSALQFVQGLEGCSDA